MPLRHNYTVMCDACRGRRYFGGKICAKCNGDGVIEIPDTFSQATAKKAGKIVFFTVLAAIVLLVALHFFGVL